MDAATKTPLTSTDLRAQFRAVADRTRRVRTRCDRMMVIALSCMVVAIVFMFFPASRYHYVGNAAFGLFFVLFMSSAAISGFSMPKLVCPQCANNLLGDVDEFCPECGSQQIKRGGFFAAPRCLSCKRSLRRNKGRPQYKIRACTRCGAWLDDEGL